MNFFLAFLSVLIFSLGNFIPFFQDDMLAISAKFTILSLLLMVLFNFQNKRIAFSKLPLFYVVIISIIFFITSLSSMDILYALDKYLSTSLVVIVLLQLSMVINRNKSFLEYAEMIVYSGLLILFLTLLYKIQFGFWNRGVRFFLNGSIVFAWLMSFYALLAFYVFNKTKKYVFLVFFFGFTLAVMWAESKGALIALILSIIFYMFADGRNYIRLPILFFVSISLIFKDYALASLDSLLGESRFGAILRVLNSDVNSQDAGSITVRQDMLVEAYNLFMSHWFSGIGLGNYQFYTAYGFPYPHNIHAEVFLECGVFVGLIYVSFLMISFFFSPKIIKSALILFFVAGCFSGDITYLRLLFFLCLLGLSFREINKPRAVC